MHTHGSTARGAAAFLVYFYRVFALCALIAVSGYSLPLNMYYAN